MSKPIELTERGWWLLQDKSHFPASLHWYNPGDVIGTGEFLTAIFCGSGDSPVRRQAAVEASELESLVGGIQDGEFSIVTAAIRAIKNLNKTIDALAKVRDSAIDDKNKAYKQGELIAQELNSLKRRVKGLLK